MKDDDWEDLLPEHHQHQQRGKRVLDDQRPAVNKTIPIVKTLKIKIYNIFRPHDVKTMAAERLTIKMRGIELTYYTDLIILNTDLIKFNQSRKQLET